MSVYEEARRYIDNRLVKMGRDQIVRRILAVALFEAEGLAKDLVAYILSSFKDILVEYCSFIFEWL